MIWAKEQLVLADPRAHLGWADCSLSLLKSLMLIQARKHKTRPREVGFGHSPRSSPVLYRMTFADSWTEMQLWNHGQAGHKSHLMGIQCWFIISYRRNQFLPCKRDTNPPKNKALIRWHLLSLYLLIWGRLKKWLSSHSASLGCQISGLLHWSNAKDLLGVQSP